jgi:hypothetical protein
MSKKEVLDFKIDELLDDTSSSTALDRIQMTKINIEAAIRNYSLKPRLGKLNLKI